MATTNAVKDPKNGVISCWVCTGVVIWIVISVYETVKYIRGKSKNNA